MLPPTSLRILLLCLCACTCVAVGSHSFPLPRLHKSQCPLCNLWTEDKALGDASSSRDDPLQDGDEYLNESPNVLLRSSRMSSNSNYMWPMFSAMHAKNSRASLAKKRNDGSSISVVDPVNVLRQNMRIDAARERLRQNENQIEANAKLLREIGKRQPKAWRHEEDEDWH